jgi:hypothetical protein
MQPNYSQYSVNELEQVIDSIDREKYPARFNSALQELKHRKLGKEPEPINLIPKDNSKKYIRLSESEIPKKKSKFKVYKFLIVLCWTITTSLALYFGKFPSKGRTIDQVEQPAWFFIVIVVWIGVGFYWYFKDDT